MSESLGQLAALAGADVVGDAGVEVTGIADLDHAGAGDLVFVEREGHLERALASGAAAVVAGETARSATPVKPLVIARQPRLTFALMAARLLPPDEDAAAGVHPTAIVDPTAALAAGVSVGPWAVVGARASVGAGTRVGPRVVLEPGVQVGEGCVLEAGGVVHRGTRLGHRVRVHAGAVLGSRGFGYVRDEATGRHEPFPQVGGLEVGDDVEIGANVTIDRGTFQATVVGRGTKIDNLVHVGHNVRIGQDVVIAAQTGIAGSSVVEDGVTVAGQVGIADHATIGTGVVLGAQSGVPTGKVLRGAGEAFWGTPARPLRTCLRELATLARLARQGGA